MHRAGTCQLLTQLRELARDRLQCGRVYPETRSGHPFTLVALTIGDVHQFAAPIRNAFQLSISLTN